MERHELQQTEVANRKTNIFEWKQMNDEDFTIRVFGMHDALQLQRIIIKIVATVTVSLICYASLIQWESFSHSVIHPNFRMVIEMLKW